MPLDRSHGCLEASKKGGITGLRLVSYRPKGHSTAAPENVWDNIYWLVNTCGHLCAVAAMSESVFCHACMATTTTEARYSNAGDRICPACDSDFIELTQASPAAQPSQAPASQPGRDDRRSERRNQGFHRHFTTPGGHNVHLHVVTSTGGLPQPLETLLSSAEPAQLTALLNNMQGMGMQGMTMPFNLPPGVSAADYGPNGGAAFDNLLQQLMEAHQPQASPTSRDTLASLPRRKVRPAAGTEVFSNTPNDLPAACGSGEPCSVCHDSMEEGAEVVELPCQHCYHEDCITSWLKDHNTCPVCRKELPVDEELRNQQQQSRQQRFQEEVQRQPAGLQGLFSQLNPFHLFGRNRNNASAAAPATAAGNSSSGNAAEHGSDPDAAALPTATAARLDSVRTSLQELQGSLQQELASLSEGHEHYSRIERQIEEAQAQLRQLQTSEDAAVGALQSAQEAHQALQDAETLQAAVQADQDDMPSLASSASSGSEDSNEDDVTEADLPPSEYADGSDSDDGMPALVADDSDSGAAHAQHQPEHSMTVDFLGHGEASMLADLLQPQLQAAGFRDIDDINDVGRDSGWDDVLPDDAGELLDDTSMPPLIDLTSPGRLNTLASGRNTPLELDEQDRIDALEGALENGRDCFLRINQDFEQRASSAASHSHQQSASETAQTANTSTPSQPQPDRRVVQRISTTSTPQNPAGPLQQQPSGLALPEPLQRQTSGLALATASDSMPENVQVNSMPVAQSSIDDVLPSASERRELRSHPLLPTPSRKRSFDPSETSSSMAGSPTAAAAQLATAETDDQELLTGSVQQSQQRVGGLLAPVAWAARGAGRLVGTILRRANSSRR